MVVVPGLAQVGEGALALSAAVGVTYRLARGLRRRSGATDLELAAALSIDPEELAGLSPSALSALRRQVVIDASTGLVRREAGLRLLQQLISDLPADGALAAAAVTVPGDVTGERADAALTALLRSQELAMPGLLAVRLDRTTALVAAPGLQLTELQRRVSLVASRLGGMSFPCTFTADAAVDLTLDEVRVKLRRRSVDEVAQNVLSPREQEVARLVAQGCSNPQIAQRLYVSRDTANAHVKHILAKLGYSSRSQIAVFWATRAQRLGELVPVDADGAELTHSSRTA